MSDTLERLSRGERFVVEPDRVERELAELWREAGQTQKDGARPVTRACLWNVIVHVERRADREGSRAADALQAVLRELPRHVACRALVLETHPAGGPELESWISANCALSDDGSKVVCSEEITIAARGRGEVHLTSLIHALLVPDVPTAVLFGGVPPRDPHVAALLEVADRVISRADDSADPRPLSRLLEVAAEPSLGLMDLGWRAQSKLRSMIAELFDPPAPEAAWRSIERVSIEGGGASAALLGGWIEASLGRSLAHAREPGGEIRCVRLEGAERFEVAGHDRSWTLCAGDAPPRHAVVDARSDAQLLARALRTRADDEVFHKALARSAG